MDLNKYFLANNICFDRFTFDNIFRYLLSLDYSNEEAKDLILYHCALSAIIFQERIDNEFYMKIKIDDGISKDLQELKRELLIEHLAKKKKF